MKYSELKKTLKDHALRITDCRMDVLELFLKSSYALSSHYLENQLANYDRVTLYRTLNAFISKGILHKIPDDSGVARYGICHDTCTPEAHNHDHIHFKCDNCNSIKCLSSVHVPPVDIPGIHINSANLIVNGMCDQCQSTEKTH